MQKTRNILKPWNFRLRILSFAVKVTFITSASLFELVTSNVSVLLGIDCATSACKIRRIQFLWSKIWNLVVQFEAYYSISNIYQKSICQVSVSTYKVAADYFFCLKYKKYCEILYFYHYLSNYKIASKKI